MKMRYLILLMALTITPLVACNANNGSSDAAADQAAPTAAPDKPDLSFLAKLGLDVSNLTIIGDVWEPSAVFVDLNKEQTIRLLPMAQFMNGGEEQIYDGRYYLTAAKALPNGYTMLLYGWSTGDDSSLEMMGIYNRDGNITDFMQLGDMNEFSDNEQNDDYTQGRAQMTDTELKFTAPAEFTLDRTIKEADWQRDPNSEDGGRDITKVYWLLTTEKTYNVDDHGHVKLADQKELKRKGNLDNDYELFLQFDDLANMPISDVTRIDKMNDLANKTKQALGDERFDDTFAYRVISGVSEFFASDPDSLLKWIYKNRKRENLIVRCLMESIENSYIEKSMFDNAINQLTDNDAKQYLKELTATWKSEVGD
ncbi:MAG: hypothetical protein J6S96_00185 [Muribaculaceae bacterium]|nr:hypothetical protein [Muribaculaceae bacterium]